MDEPTDPLDLQGSVFKALYNAAIRSRSCRDREQIDAEATQERANAMFAAAARYDEEYSGLLTFMDEHFSGWRNELDRKMKNRVLGIVEAVPLSEVDPEHIELGVEEEIERRVKGYHGE